VPVLNNDTSSIAITNHISINILNTPKHGIAVGSTQAGSTGVYFYPSTGFIGMDSFTYVLCDTLLIKPYCDTAKVYLTTRPIAKADEYGSLANALPCGTTLLAILGNDAVGNTNTTNIKLIETANHGIASIVNNQVQFLAEEGYRGADHFKYEITVNGMKDSADVLLEVNCVPCEIPSGFSPNGDLANQYFVIDCITNFPGNELTIFNRWGNIVFNEKNYQNNWDAKYNGSDLPDGTYFYKIKFNDGISKDKNGFLIIAR